MEALWSRLLSAVAILLTPGFLHENLDILTTIIIGNSHLPNRSTGIPLYVHRLVIEFVCSVYFIFSVLCQITGRRRQNATKA